MAEVLVAPLGDHPAVISATIKKLKQEGVAIEHASILCPNQPLIMQGAEWLRLELEITFDLETDQYNLPFPDANSEQAAKQYLQALAAMLQTYEAMNDNIHLLLAGGRKNLSALTATIAQFFPCVKKVYHLIDKYEDDPLRRNLFSVDELIGMNDQERKQKMFPPVDSLILFELPRMPVLKDASARRKSFADLAACRIPSVTVDSAADAFWRAVFGTKIPEKHLTLWLSEAAWKDYKDLNPEMRLRFENCFEKMTTNQSLGAHRHEAFPNKQFKTDCQCFDADGNPARPFYYRDGERLILCRLVSHPDTYERLISGHNSVFKKDHAAFEPLHGLLKTQSILVVSLGDSPMVASQAYVLLQQQSQVACVVFLYPEDHRGISNKAHDLKMDFEREGVACELKPIPKLKDVSSTADCELYLRFVAQAITDLQGQYKDTEINLLLSGGRKSMAALNLFAAQRAGLNRVWHTLVNDSMVEQQIDYVLKQPMSSTERRNIFFLRAFPLDQFTLFPVPIFPVSHLSPLS